MDGGGEGGERGSRWRARGGPAEGAGEGRTASGGEAAASDGGGLEILAALWGEETAQMT